MSDHPPSPMAPPQIFAPRRVAALRARSARLARDEVPFLDELRDLHLAEMVEDLANPRPDALVIGWPGAQVRAALAARAIRWTMLVPPGAPPASDGPSVAWDGEAMLPLFGPNSFDVILWPGGLEMTNDLPGLLVQARQMLRPDGAFLGVGFGAGTLSALRDLIPDNLSRHVVRFHPTVDVRGLGDLLQRAGFAMPFVQSDPQTVRYRSLVRALGDLRAAALTATLADTAPPFGRADYDALHAAADAAIARDGAIIETFVMLSFIGWSPFSASAAPAP